MEDETDDQKSEYIVEQYETQAKELEEDESSDALMVNSEIIEDNSHSMTINTEMKINDMHVLKKI
jgi:hypothetical protein